MRKDLKSKKGLIRTPSVDDLKDLLRIERTCFKRYYREHRFTEDQFLYYLKNESTIAFVAEQGGALTGYVLGITQNGRLRDIAKIHSIAVMPGERRKGVGQQLVRAFIESARKRRAKKVTLEVAELNKQARRFLSHAGFQEGVRTLDYYGRGYHGIRMHKAL